MSVQTNKKAYKRHHYSGPRKSLKRVRGGLRQFYGAESRLKVWRFEQNKNPSTNQDQGPTNQDQEPTNQDQEPTNQDQEPINQDQEPTNQDQEPSNQDQEIIIENVVKPLSEKEIKVFCPKCKTEITHTAEGIQDDQTKILVAKVYHYFEQEYEEFKTIYGDLDLTPLSKFRQRTALATGVSESTVLHILQEEEGRNAEKRQEPPEERRRARKRYRDTNSSSEDNSLGDNAGNNEQSSNPQDEEPEIYFPVGEVEVNMEQAQNDPISLEVKTEPQADVVDDTNEPLAPTEPAGPKRKERKILTKCDVTSTRSSLIGDEEISGGNRRRRRN